MSSCFFVCFEMSFDSPSEDNNRIVCFRELDMEDKSDGHIQQINAACSSSFVISLSYF